MFFNKSFELRDVCGEQVLIANGVENIDFGALINLNSTAADIYKHFVDKNFTLDDVVAYITSEYDVTPEQAKADVEKLIASLVETGVIKA